MAAFFGGPRGVQAGAQPIRGPGGMPGVMGTANYRPLGGPAPAGTVIMGPGPGGTMSGGAGMSYMGAPVMGPGGPQPNVVYVDGARSGDGGCSLRSVILAILFLLVLVLIAVAVFLVVVPTAGASQSEEKPVSVSHDASAAFDCFTDFTDWQKKWSDRQQNYCCMKESRACPTVTKAPAKYECTTSQSGWTSKQKEFCCHKWGTGCPKVQYNCFAGNVESWAEKQRQFCCTTAKTGCPKVQGQHYDCEAGYSNADNAWSDGKKEWCCKHEGAGCKEESTKAPYDCEAGYSNWKNGWSDGKKQWCCDHESKGCNKPYDCEAGYANWKAGWSDSKKKWCCDHEERGCVETVVKNNPYDCKAGYLNWKKGWSDAKQDWCCEHESKGCPKLQTTSGRYDCTAGLKNWAKGWADDKKKWCCLHESVACVEPYNCRAGFSNWQRGWSTGKKDYCCRKHQLGCAVSEAADLYDCRTDLEAKSEWPQHKVAWCCSEKNVACKARVEPETAHVTVKPETDHGVRMIAGVPVHPQAPATPAPSSSSVTQPTCPSYKDSCAEGASCKGFDWAFSCSQATKCCDATDKALQQAQELVETIEGAGAEAITAPKLVAWITSEAAKKKATMVPAAHLNMLAQGAIQSMDSDKDSSLDKAEVAYAQSHPYGTNFHESWSHIMVNSARVCPNGEKTSRTCSRMGPGCTEGCSAHAVGNGECCPVGTQRNIETDCCEEDKKVEAKVEVKPAEGKETTKAPTIEIAAKPAAPKIEIAKTDVKTKAPTIQIATKPAAPKIEHPAIQIATKPAAPKIEHPAIQIATKPAAPKIEHPAIQIATKPAAPAIEIATKAPTIEIATKTAAPKIEIAGTPTISKIVKQAAAPVIQIAKASKTPTIEIATVTPKPAGGGVIAFGGE